MIRLSYRPLTKVSESRNFYELEQVYFGGKSEQLIASSVRAKVGCVTLEMIVACKELTVGAEFDANASQWQFHHAVVQIVPNRRATSAQAPKSKQALKQPVKYKSENTVFEP